MLIQRQFERGITMIEVMVTIAIVAIAATIGIPSLSNWMQNIQVRSTAESVLTGLQLARAEAVRQNVKARFQLTSTSGKASWVIITDSLTAPGTFPVANQVQTSGASESGANARLGVSTGTLSSTNYASAIAANTGMGTNPLPGVVFSAFGQVVTDASVTKITRIDVTNSAYSGARRMVITITDSGMAKLCDPSLPAGNSRGCS